MIVFVGDQPSNKNVDPNIPFVGTQSYKRLLEWIWKMDVNITDVEIYNKDDIDMQYKGRPDRYLVCGYWPRNHYPDEIEIVALGNEAAKKLEELGLEYFKLPHPSGRNRLLNDKKYVEMKLKECKEWLNI